MKFKIRMKLEIKNQLQTKTKVLRLILNKFKKIHSIYNPKSWSSQTLKIKFRIVQSLQKIKENIYEEKEDYKS